MVQPVHPLLLKALSPARNGRAVVYDEYDLLIGLSVGQSQNQSGSKHVTNRQHSRLRELGKLRPLLISYCQQHLIPSKTYQTHPMK
jgi:hypothetical protein